MLTANEKHPAGTGSKRKPRRHSQSSTTPRQGSTRSPADGPSPVSDSPASEAAPQAGGDQARHVALMRMLATIRDRVWMGISARDLFRAAALAGYNANPEMAGLEPGMKALNADQDALALLEVASDEIPTP